MSVRVVFVIAGSVFGGPANVLAQLHGPLRERGFDTVGVFPDEAGDAAERLSDLGVETHRVPMHRARATRNIRSHLTFAAHAPFDVHRLKRLLRNLDADVVQHHGDLNPHGAVAARRAGAAVAWQIADTRTPAALRRITAPLITGLSDVVMTWGRALGERYRGVVELGARHVVVFPPVDLDRFHPPSAAVRAAARERLGVEPGALLVGSIGNRNPQKGQDALLRAAALARSRVPGLTVRALGAPSPGHEAYEASIHRSAATAGFDGGTFRMLDPGSDVHRLLPGFDVLVVSSPPRSEGVPTVLGEAMACGVPVISTDVGAVTELVTDGVEGTIVPPLDDHALATAITQLADPQRRRQLGAAGRAHMEQAHGLARCADDYARGYELALAHRDHRRR